MRCSSVSSLGQRLRSCKGTRVSLSWWPVLTQHLSLNQDIPGGVGGAGTESREEMRRTWRTEQLSPWQMVSRAYQDYTGLLPKYSSSSPCNKGNSTLKSFVDYGQFGKSHIGNSTAIWIRVKAFSLKSSINHFNRKEPVAESWMYWVHVSKVGEMNTSFGFSAEINWM